LDKSLEKWVWRREIHANSFEIRKKVLIFFAVMHSRTAFDSKLFGQDNWP
jgi:hypothetical protein